ncbi:hypothetical protein JCM10213_005975 [Rhodosporidiobolus nylandii]
MHRRLWTYDFSGLVHGPLPHLSRHTCSRLYVACDDVNDVAWHLRATLPTERAYLHDPPCRATQASLQRLTQCWLAIGEAPDIVLYHLGNRLRSAWQYAPRPGSSWREWEQLVALSDSIDYLYRARRAVRGPRTHPEWLHELVWRVRDLFQSEKQQFGGGKAPFLPGFQILLPFFLPLFVIRILLFVLAHLFPPAMSAPAVNALVDPLLNALEVASADCLALWPKDEPYVADYIEQRLPLARLEAKFAEKERRLLSLVLDAVLEWKGARELARRMAASKAAWELARREGETR